MEDNNKKFSFTVFYILGFIVAIFFELYWINNFPYDYFMLIGIGLIVLITGYLTFDTAIRAYNEAQQIKREQNEIMIKAQKAIYLATKKNAAEAEKIQISSLKAVNMLMDRMVDTITEKQIDTKANEPKDLNSLIAEISESNAKLAKEVQNAITVNQLVKANEDLLKNVHEVLGTKQLSTEATVETVVPEPVDVPAPQETIVMPEVTETVEDVENIETFANVTEDIETIENIETVADITEDIETIEDIVVPETDDTAVEEEFIIPDETTVQEELIIPDETTVQEELIIPDEVIAQKTVNSDDLINNEVIDEDIIVPTEEDVLSDIISETAMDEVVTVDDFADEDTIDDTDESVDEASDINIDTLPIEDVDNLNEMDNDIATVEAAVADVSETVEAAVAADEIEADLAEETAITDEMEDDSFLDEFAAILESDDANGTLSDDEINDLFKDL